MKAKLLILLFIVSIGGNLRAQLRFYDASEFPLLGKATQSTTSLYERFPDSLEVFLTTTLGVESEFGWDVRSF